MPSFSSRAMTFTVAAALSAALGGTAFAQKKYDTGASDTEIKIGNIMPYSGPASAYGVIGKMEEAYFKMINDQGGINGRKINYITYDDGYSPPKAVEQARKLVESDEVLFIAELARHPVELRHSEIHECEESPATVRGPPAPPSSATTRTSLDHGLAARLSERGPGSMRPIC